MKITSLKNIRISAIRNLFTLRNLGLFLIIAGLLVLSRPIYQWGYAAYHQRKALAMLHEPLNNSENAAEDKKASFPQVEKEEDSKEGLPNYLGLLEIEKLKVKAVVDHGITEDTLKKGPGFYPQSSHPEVGNVAIASHRARSGSYFLHIDKLEPGDEIKLTFGDTTYVYAVTDNFVTHSRDWSVIDSTGKPEITLTTCIITDLSVRLIVKGELVDIIKNPRSQQFEIQ
jgi:sortase A